MEIKQITPKEADLIWDSQKSCLGKYSPLGLFWLYENGFYVGIDNSTGDAWMEDFKSKKACFEWLKEA